ncbi:hypothetical protein ACMHYO_06680 [Allopusillimonas ginsengisoli]|uniref:hypothetical protein n=1 Tax=Allopusillimonas ginsengisoli TaxID=453575 RepID=UPI0039C00BA7
MKSFPALRVEALALACVLAPVAHVVAADARYKDAVRYRWRKDGTERLIPPEWPTSPSTSRMK